MRVKKKKTKILETEKNRIKYQTLETLLGTEIKKNWKLQQTKNWKMERLET